MIQRSLFKKDTVDIPVEIQSLAEKEELGKLRTIYSASKQYTGIRVPGEIFLFFGVVWVSGVILAIRFSTFPPSPGYIVPGLILSIIGSFMAFWQGGYSHWHVYLWQNGFLYEKGQIRQVFRWNQIETVEGSAYFVRNQYKNIVYRYKVRRQDGYEVKLDNVFLKISELVDIVLEESARQFASQDLRIIPSRSKTFTVLKLDRQGIGNGQETLSWQEIQEFTTTNGTITLLKKDE